MDLGWSRMFTFRSSVVLCVVMAPRIVSAVPELTGPEVSNVAAQSINVLRTLTHETQARLQLDATPFYANLAMRSTPANFLVNNGQVISGASLRRYGGSIGIGAGKPRTGLAFFTGLAYDRAGIVAVNETADPLGVKYEDYFSDYVAYAGLSYAGVALTGGVRLTSTWANRDQYDQIVVPGYSTSDQIPYRPGSPVTEATSPFVRVDSERRVTTLLSLTAPSDSLLEVALAELPRFGQPETSEQRLTGLRGSTALAWLAEALELRDYGVPVVGYNRFAPEVDYYGDRYQAYHDAIIAQVAPPAPRRDATQEVVLGLDDLLGTGVRLRAASQFAPVMLFRFVEASASLRQEIDLVSWMRTTGTLGARATLFRRAVRYVPSVEAFVALGLGRVQLTGSYAYNAPDAGTFFPVPDAQVWGFLLAYGPVEMTRPLVPLQAEVQP